jgi:hypothetical protein
MNKKGMTNQTNGKEIQEYRKKKWIKRRYRR